MDVLVRERFDPRWDQYISVQESHYSLRLEKPFSMNARTFFEEAMRGGAYEILSDADIALGEVVEIDDGLKPYFFYIMSWSKVVPMSHFDRSRVQKGD